MKPCILIVEDDLSLREILYDVFEGEGYTVILAENGVVALQKLEQGINPFLILTDHLMPEMNGTQFIHKKNEHPVWKTIPVILFSANTMKDPLPEGVETLSKPFDFMDLMNRIRAHLKS